MRFNDPETELFLYHVEREEKIRQIDGFRLVSASRPSLAQRARQYWQQYRSSQATPSPAAPCTACCH